MEILYFCSGHVDENMNDSDKKEVAYVKQNLVVDKNSSFHIHKLPLNLIRTDNSMCNILNQCSLIIWDFIYH